MSLSVRKSEEVFDITAVVSDRDAILPDGGWPAWGTVLGAWLIQFCTVGISSTFGVYQDYYTVHYLSGSSASTISWIGSIQLFLELAVGPIGGYLVDRGQFRAVLVGGSVLFLFCFFMLSLAQPGAYYQIFLSQGMGMGIAIGLLYLPTTGVVSAHFTKWKALAMGVMDTGGSVGGAVFSIAMNQLLSGSFGFPWANRIVAFISLGCVLAGCILMREPKSAPRPLNLNPSVQVSSSSLRAIFCDINYLLALSVGFCFSFGTYAPINYLQLFEQLHGLNAELCFYSLAILNLSSCFGRSLPNVLADHYGMFKIYVPCVALSGALSFGLLGCGTAPGAIIFAIVYGFFSGAGISLYFPMIARLEADPSNIGKRIGFAGVPVGIALGFGLPLSGALIGTDYKWYRGMIFAAVTQIVGAICLAIIGIRLSRKKESR